MGNRKLPTESTKAASKNINPGVSIPGAPLVYREGLDRNFQSTIVSLEIFNPEGRDRQFFDLFIS